MFSSIFGVFLNLYVAAGHSRSFKVFFYILAQYVRTRLFAKLTWGFEAW